MSRFSYLKNNAQLKIAKYLFLAKTNFLPAKRLYNSDYVAKTITLAGKKKIVVVCPGSERQRQREAVGTPTSCGSDAATRTLSLRRCHIKFLKNIPKPGQASESVSLTFCVNNNIYFNGWL